MKTFSVRHVQHNLAAVLEVVRRGQEITITKRGTPIARLVAVRPPHGTVRWPDSAARMKRLGPSATAGTPASEIIQEMRGDRF